MPIVDVRFRLVGDLIPADHGYLLFSSVSRVIQALHGDGEVAVHPVSGRLLGDRRLALTETSFLTIRLASERVGQVMPLAGKALRIGEFEVLVGVPHSRALMPSPNLYSRLVVIKGFMEPDTFLEAASRQLEAMEIRAQPLLVAQPQVERANAGMSTGSHSSFLRRTIRIRDKEVVGFALRVNGLTPAQSLRLQEAGLGGRQRFGCGIFVPDRRQTA